MEPSSFLPITLSWRLTGLFRTILSGYFLQVYSIRDAAANNLKRLAEEFGPEWAVLHIIPQVCVALVCLNFTTLSNNSEFSLLLISQWWCWMCWIEHNSLGLIGNYVFLTIRKKSLDWWFGLFQYLIVFSASIWQANYVAFPSCFWLDYCFRISFTLYVCSYLLKNWILKCHILLQVLEMSTNPHYLYRMTILRAVSLLAPVMGSEITCSKLLPVVINASKDRYWMRGLSIRFVKLFHSNPAVSECWIWFH